MKPRCEACQAPDPVSLRQLLELGLQEKPDPEDSAFKAPDLCPRHRRALAAFAARLGDDGRVLEASAG
ncbi:MAG: hypothetical protein ABSH07_12715 [Candidatus Dormibacteria bacterium]|jgi:hypothetical protein